jgi:HK97 family phage portal protein
MASLTRRLLNRAPVAYAARTLPGGLTGGTRNDAIGHMQAYGQVSTLFSVVSRIFDAVSRVEWHLYRTNTDARRVTATGQENERTEVIRHAALNIWLNPNPHYTNTELVQTIQQHQDLTGEWVLAVVRAQGINLPIELWPIRPDRITPIPHPTDFLAGYIYHGPNGEQVPLQLDEIIHSKLPNPLDPYRGLGPVQSALVDLDSARYSAEWNRNFFLNSAEPGGHLETDLNLEDDEFKQLTTRWREQHQGVYNAHRVAVLEGGVKWKDRQFNMRDMQFNELRGLSREIIREAFGMHPHMLGLTEDVNKANAQEAERHFARWLVQTRVDRITEKLNRSLLPMFGTTGQGVEFATPRVVPEDREADDRERQSKAEAFKALVEAGVDESDAAMAVGLPQMKIKPKPQPAPLPAQQGNEPAASV